MSITSQNVTDSPNNNTLFMVWNFKPHADIKYAFQKLCALTINLNHSAGIRFPGSNASVVMGIGYDAWHALSLPEPLPKEFEKFAPIKGAKYTAVATDGDLHFHIRCHTPSYCIDLAGNITDLLLPVADCIEEVHGFRYWDGRSILGFVDGTENPVGDDRNYFGIIGDEDTAYKGGSYLFVQKYLHDINAWRALPVSEQEKVIGRSKNDDIEMSDDTKPANSHSALANVGDDFKIVRDNMPFGNITTNEMGTYFIGYASSFSIIKKMLTNMYVGNPAGNYDRILDFSRPVTGSSFFVPSLDMLDSFTD